MDHKCRKDNDVYGMMQMQISNAASRLTIAIPTSRNYIELMMKFHHISNACIDK